MASDEERGSRPSRRHYEDEDNEPQDADHRPKYSGRDSGRRERRRSRDQRERRRSRTPESIRRRSRSRDRDRDRNREHRRRRSRDEKHSRRRCGDGDDGNDKRVAKRSPVRRTGPLPSQADSFAVTTGEAPEKPKEKPNFGSTGVLAAASNSVAQADGTTITLKYHEPTEARKPSPRDVWKLFIFKGQDIIDTIELSARSCWLVGREISVVDLPAEHPSISKQHAVIQFRHVEKRNEFGDKIGKVKPYLIDLESANGTMLNDSRIPDSRYLELRDKDMIQFGHSTREYVVMLAPRD
ncbi:hypothetical protein F53441_11292 [Fusarium austroafricanum]|uniref:FHA domain-containing protein n=1 Tax=Fusarium austroafricanum TaxID=2364996 RepID=A0A8H4K6S7_9HYPO|nr:hypothetical protein F53441_11292 [Fusarium austroafricanum]